MAKTKGEKLAERLTTPIPREKPVPPESLLSTGCTLLNLALSGTPNGGVPKGTYAYIVGDSGSSKTWFTFCMFAEAALNPHFKNYRFVFDNAENGALMDVARYFGPGVVPRLVPPKGTPKSPEHSSTAQEFFWNLELNCRKGPCIYVLDSMDALTDDSDDEKFEAELKRHTTGTGEVPGSMGMAKAKTNSRNINREVRSLRQSGSILVVISQTRDKVNARFPTKTRGGGHALKFYSHLEIWTSVREPLTTRFGGKERMVGDIIGIEVSKNRLCGWEGKIEVPFIKGIGIDDMGGLVDFMLDERSTSGWTKERGKKDEDGASGDPVFTAPEFKFTGRKESFIKHIQDNGDEFDLQRRAAEVWQIIVQGSLPVRKMKYT